MNFPWWRKLFPKPRKVTKTKRPGARVKPRTAASLRLEGLEDRVVPATLHWIGVDSLGATNPGLNGAYYNIGATQGLIDNTNSAWLGNPANNYVSAATAVLTGAIDFPDIAGNGFQDNQGKTYYNIPGNDNNVEGRWTGQILIPGTGTTPVPISFLTASDDGSTLYIDGSLVVNNNNFQGVTSVQNTVSLTPGLHNIDIEFYQGGGGGAAMFAQWDPNGGSNFVDIPPSAFFLPSANWSDPKNWREGVVPHNGDTVVFDSSVTGSGAYNAINNIPGLTLNGIVIKNTSSTPFIISGDAVTINNVDPTLTSGISDASTTTLLLSLNSITLDANTNIDNTSAFPTNTTPSLIISSNIDLAGHVLSSGPSLADDAASTPDTGWSEITGVISSSVANTDAIVESSYGVMALAGLNTYDGPTNVFNGVLVAAGTNSLGSTTGAAKTVNPNANPLPGNPGAALGVANGGDSAAYTNGVTLQGAGPSAIGGALWNAVTNTNVFNAPIKLAGATTFQINNGSLSLGGSLNIGSNALTIAGNHNLTIGGVITGSASSSITDNNTATTTLTKNNAPFLGSININQGILAAAANHALGVGTGAVTVANGAALGFTNNVNYNTAQPVTITGSGPGGNGAVEGIGGTDTFAGPVTVSSGDEYLGATAGQLSLGASVSLTGSNLFLVDNGGNLFLTGAISGPTTSTISKTGSGTATLSADNSGFQGATTVSAGLLAAAVNNALGDGVHSTVQVLDGGGLGFFGGINYSTPQAVSIIGSGSAGNGAVENVSGTNSFAGPITLNLGGDATVGADSGTALILSGNIDLVGQTLTVTGATLASGNTLSVSLTHTGSGLLAVNGNLDITGSTLAGVVDSTIQAGDSFTIATFTGTLTGTFANESNGVVVVGGDLFSITYNTNSIVLTITPAGSTTRVTLGNEFINSSVIYDGSPHGATASWASTGTDGGGASLQVYYVGVGATSYASTMTAPTDAGSYEASASFAGDTDHTGSSGSADFTITPAGSTTRVTLGNEFVNSSVTYDGSPHGATASWTSTGTDGGGASLQVYYVGIDGTSYASSRTAPTDAGSYEASASFAGDTDHTGSSSSADLTIAQAGSTTTVADAGGIYTGSAFAAAAEATGAGGLDDTNLADFTFSYAGTGATAYGPSSIAPVGLGTYTVTATYQGDTDHTGSSSTTAPFDIDLISGFGGNGTGWSSNGTATISNNVATLTSNQGSQAGSVFDDTQVSTAGNFTADFTYTPSGNDQADGSAFVLQSVSSTAVGGDGGALGYGGIGSSLAVALNIYSGHTIGTALYTDGIVTGVYQSVSPVVLNSGDPINIALSYDASSQTLTETLTDADNDNTATVTYTNVNVSALVGDSAYVGFTGGTGGGTSTQQISNFQTTLLLGTTTTVTDNGGIYTGSAYPVTAVTATGPGSLDDTNLADFTISYYAGTYASVTALNNANLTALDGAPSMVGAYTALAVWAPEGDYGGSSAVADFTITPAGSTTRVTLGNEFVNSSVTYDGLPHGATANWASTGTDGGGASLQVYYVGIDGTNYASTTTAPTDAGDYEASASFAGDTDHTGSSSSADFTITPAGSTTRVTLGNEFVNSSVSYDGSPHGATASWASTGTDGAGASLQVYYVGVGATNYASTTTAPTDAGSYEASANFAGDTDHTGSSSSADFTITTTAPAGSTTRVTLGNEFVNNSVTYDGSPHGATASWTSTGTDGGGAALQVYYVGIDATSYASTTTAPTDAGDYEASASFAGDTDHTGSSGVADFTINKANATVVVTSYTTFLSPQLDQSQTNYSYGLGFAAGNVYQTFTAGLSGLLTSLVLYQNGYFGGSSTIGIRQGAGLGGALLATGTANWSTTGAITIEFTTPATVVAGSVYTIDLANGVPSGATVSTADSLLVAAGNLYSGGYLIDQPWTGSSVDQGLDLYFQTFVEPSVNGVTYDGTAHTATVASITGVNGETGATAGSVTLNTTHTNAGTYSDSWSFTGAANYNSIASTPITDIINQAALTITATDQTQTYGFGGTSASLGTSAFTSSGLQNGETVGGVTLTTNATTSTSGNYNTDAFNSGNPWTITPAATGGTFTPSNYTITYDTGSLTVNPLAVTLTGSRTCDGTTTASFSILSITNIIDGDNVSLASGSATLSSQDAGAPSISSTTLMVTGTAASDYTTTGGTGTVTITPAGSTTRVTLGNEFVNGSVSYDGSPHGATASWASSGTDGGGAALQVYYVGVGATSYASTTTAPTDAGDYEASASFAGDTDHTGSNGVADFTINKAEVTVTATGSQTYGGANKTFTPSYSGFVNVDDPSVISGTPLYSTSATASSPVSGSYTASADVSGLLATNYTFMAGTPGTFTVNPALLTVTATGSQTYGGTNQSFTPSYSGFVNREDPSVISGTPLYSTSATASSPVSGSYTASADVSGLLAANYTFMAGTPGTFTVNPALLTVTAANQSITYGGSRPALTFTYTGLANGDVAASFSGALSDLSSPTTAGVYAGDIVQGTLAATGNYTIGTFHAGTLTINPKTPTLSFAALTALVGYRSGLTITLSATSNSPAAVAFSILGSSTGSGTIGSTTTNAGTTTATLTVSAAGTFVLQASQVSNTNWTAPAVLQQNVVVQQANDVITLSALPIIPLSTSPVTLNATGGGSSSPVVYTVLSGPGHASGNQLTVTALGSVLIEASQAGDANYTAATPVFQTVKVEKAQTIKFTQPTSPVRFGVKPITLSASASSRLPITFRVISGPGTITGTKLTVTGAGSIVIEADQAGNFVFAAAPPVQRTLVVNKVNQTITFKALAAVSYGAGPITLGATASSGLPIAYTVVSGPGSVSGNHLTITGAGAIVVKTTQAGNANDNAATAVTRTLTVNKATLTVTANNAAWTAGQAGQSLDGFTISGLVPGDTQASLFGTQAAVVSCPTVNANDPKAGSYVINITQGTLLSPANYTLTFRKGTLRVH